MYTSFFGLNEKPFELLPNPKYLFPSKGHKKALSYLEYGIQERAGFTLLTGEVGSGKTTLLRNIINSLGGAATLAMVFNTQVDAVELLALINEDFGLDVASKDKVALLRDLNEFLIEENSNNHRPILIIDEAQNLSVELLEQIRLLSNLELDSSKMLQIILVGQPELKKLISRPELRQLRQRISVSCHLGPLSPEETEAYIFHRLEIAGNRQAVTFQPEVFSLIHQFAHGSPRLINVIGDFLLLTAFVEGTRTINVAMVQEAIDELSVTVCETEEVEKKEIEDASMPASLAMRIDALEEKLASIIDRFEVWESTHGCQEVLEYLVNQQQRQFDSLNICLKKMNYLIARLKSIFPPDEE